MYRLSLLMAAAALLASPIPSAAQQKQPPAPVPAAPVPPARLISPATSMPGAEVIVMLIRTAVLTLNDALLTGNFTVMRDLSAPGFRDGNNAARLSQIFANLAGTDLSSIATAPPQLTQQPAFDAKGMLHIKGRFQPPAAPVDFELLFQNVSGRWRVFGISVQPVPQAAATAAPEVKPKPPAAAVAPKPRRNPDAPPQ